MILAGDVGGTHSRFALYDEKGGGLHRVHDARYLSSEFGGLDDLLDAYLQESAGSPNKICLGLAGPVRKNRCQLTHLGWKVDGEALKSRLQVETVALLNDFAALACSIPFLTPADLKTIQSGQPGSTGNIGILGAGTGLGQAFLIPQKDDQWVLVETEGGHTDFPAQSPLEQELVQFLNKKYHRVCVEHVLSGNGLVSLYEFFQSRNPEPEPEWLKTEFEEGDPAEVISRVGMQGGFSSCEQALSLFVSAYGAVAGNLALQIVARGGIYVGGGIAPRILPWIESDRFLKPFCAKAKFESLMQEIPVHVIVNETSALLGAAHYIWSGCFIRNQAHTN